VDALTGSHTIVSKRHQSTNGYIFAITVNGELFWVQGGTGVSMVAAPSLITPASGWQHCVVTSDGVTTRLYIDGTLRVSQTSEASVNSTAPFHVGQGSAFNSTPFDGQIDDVGVWSRALSPGEVWHLYNAGTGKAIDDQTAPGTPTISGNTITGFLCDGGVTQYEVILDLVGAGVSPGTRASLMANLV
jgi:hypothetical protein